MKQIFFIALLALFVVATLAEEPQQEDGVYILTDKNFDDFLLKHDYVLVKFYAPWCGHCKSLAPEYAKAAKKLSEEEKPVPLGKVDATVEKDLAERFEVEGYPTLKFFINSNPIEFGGGRTEDEIVSWIKKKTGPSSIELGNEQDFEKFVADNEVAVAFFGDNKSKEYEIFEQVSKTFEDVVFAYTTSTELKDKYKVDAVPNVVLFKQFDEKRNDFTGEFTADALTTFIDEWQFPVIMTFTQKTAEKIFGDNQPCLFLFLGEGDSSVSAEAALKEASNELKGKILMSTSQIKDGMGERLADYIGIKEADVPTLRIVSPTENEVKKFLFNEEITTGNILRWVDDYKNDKLTPFFKSEDIPESDDGPVKVLVGHTFSQVINDETKDVFVKFYAPWCGHCKALVPIFEKVAERVKGNPNLIIAKIDATANEVEGIPIQGFPTIKFWPANNKKEPIDYEGERTEEEFMKFLKEKTTTSWVEEEKKSEL